MELFLLLVVIVLAGVFAFINGFHDASNSVAAVVRTRAATPTVAVLLAGLFNLVGVMLSTGLAEAISSQWLNIPRGHEGLGILIAGLLSASVWGLLTWRRGMPSSSTHALIGGLVGSGAASVVVGGSGIGNSAGVLWSQLTLPLLISPLLAFGLSYVLVSPSFWLSRYSAPRRVNSANRSAQLIFAAMFSLGHGLQDSQRTIAVVLLGLAASGMAGSEPTPLWVQVFAAVLLTAGTVSGGWRITHTLANRLVRIDPLRGMMAQGVTAGLLFVAGMALHVPVSSTHTMTSAIVGAGSNQRFGAVRWHIFRRILGVWLATALVTGLAGAVLYLALDPLI